MTGIVLERMGMTQRKKSSRDEVADLRVSENIHEQV